MGLKGAAGYGKPGEASTATSEASEAHSEPRERSRPGLSRWYSQLLRFNENIPSLGRLNRTGIHLYPQEVYSPDRPHRPVGLQKRDLLRGAAVIVTIVIPGCSSDPTTGDPNEGDSGNTSREGSSEISETETRNGLTVSDLEEDCITAEFSGYVNTTPVPAPERPEHPDSDSVVEYSVAYERYYNRYLALYSIGSPTPESTDLPAHGFPDVTLNALV